MSEAMPELMTVPEVAEYLRVHQSTVYRLLARSGLPGFRVGSDWRISRAAVIEWMEQRSQNSQIVR